MPPAKNYSKFDREKDTLRLLARLVVEGPRRGEKLPEGLEKTAARAGVLELLGCEKSLARKLPSARAAFLSQAAEGMLRLEALRQASDVFEKAGIEFIPLKGMAYALLFESGGPVRAMADIDILVRPRDFQQAAAALLGLGYREVRSHPLMATRFYHERQFVRERTMIELHRTFLPPGRIRVDYEDLWRRALPLEKEGVRCRVLSPEDMFLYHCFHMGLHEFSMGGLRQLLELERLLGGYPPNLPVCARRARLWGIRRMCYCALRLFDICLPGRLEKKTIELFAPPLPVAAVLDRLVVAPSLKALLEPGLLPRPEQLFRKALLVERPLGAVKYLGWYLLAWMEAALKNNPAG